MSGEDLRVGDVIDLTDRSNGHRTDAIVTDSGGCAIPAPTRPVPIVGRMPHETTDARQQVVVSRSSSRRELARIVVVEMVPAIQQLQHNDRVTQEVCKGILAAVEAMKTQMEADAKRLTAIETMSFGARLRWAFTFTKKEA